MRPSLHILSFALFVAACLIGCSDEDDAPAPTIKGRTEVPEGADGKPCITDDDCNSESCLMQSHGFPDGHCTTFNCDRLDCSGEASVCAALWDGTPACLLPCEADEECRDGYTCQSVSGQAESTCLPAGGGIDPAEAFEPTRDLLAFDCAPTEIGQDDIYGPTYTFTFDLGAEAQSFLMVPMVAEGVVVPLSMQTPSTSVDLQTDYRHHNARLGELDFIPDLAETGTFGQVGLDWPILVPYAPQYADYVEAGGTYELTVAADTATPCLYVVEGKTGTTIDLNIYLVGAGGRTAEDAKDDPDLAAVFARVDEIYAQAGIELGEVRFFDVPAHVRETFRVLRSQVDVYKLTAYGEPPDETLDGHLSVDLFLVDDMQFHGANVLGISAGVPGAAGLHGNPRNGLVFQTVDLGADNDHVAHILAHEVGHYVGLRHTTEVYKGTNTDAERQIDRMMGVVDPIEDTAICEEIQQTGFDCPDADNLMFPAAPPAHLSIDPRLTPGQKAVFQASPLVKR
ncbi:hypothetical protein FIV42_07775 [Persicimonas caeni]|uniref:Matrixin family metalloprotease n=1 Tax=Persicimonas caeni TaxID=2292766 RepID=A0A4Y6PQY3_PERCE|nr:M57 family metalloprotease [Persicimonas caeni]QDG50633.1 hypothetical protein FIV42_07775 [Persicimonas caeni]QED31854.1 hypothetical protein FRD00_07770 [Persicimonas caeni]